MISGENQLINSLNPHMHKMGPKGLKHYNAQIP